MAEERSKVAIVTGASRGIGAAVAERLARDGFTVVINYSGDAAPAEALARKIEDKGGRALTAKADVSDPQAVHGMFDAVEATFGGVDVLVNNAGIMPLSPLERLKVEEWDRMIDVNLKGVLYGIAAALPHMQEQRAGHIINLSSVAGHKLFGGSAVYSATKFAVRALSEGLRQEVTPHNIRVTIISPGAVKTELLDHISETDVQQANREYVGQVGVPAHAFARVIEFAIGQPEELDVNEILFRPTSQEL
jgi:NADP-dependent 3-hydroxy acid dehydrogenase YdfG